MDDYDDDDDILLLALMQAQNEALLVLNDIVNHEPDHHKYKRLNLENFSEGECVYEFRFKKQDLYKYAKYPGGGRGTLS